MKKVKVFWTEFHNYSAEIEIPDNLSKEEELDWVEDWAIDALPDPSHKLYEINTDWDSFHIEEMKQE
jgi:hypothetical protein